MTRIDLKKIGMINLLILFLFIVDRILKYYFFKNPAVKLGGDFLSGLNFHFEKNAGIAFGISVNQKILLTLIILIFFILVYYLINSYKKNNFLEIFSLTLILGGAVSNLLDRLNYGFVVDYIDLPWFTVFNLADIIIICGVVILLADILFGKKGLDKSNKIDIE